MGLHGYQGRRRYPAVASLLFCSFLGLGADARANVQWYSPESLAQKWQGRIHPGEAPRSEEFRKSLGAAARWIRCAALVSAYSQKPGKVFHEHTIGATFCSFKRATDLPAILRTGFLSDSVPETLWGLASYTRGRDISRPNQLVPDVLGLSVGLLWQNRLVSFTSTAARGAFARNGLRFSRLAGFSAIGQMGAGLLTPGALLENQLSQREYSAQHGDVGGGRTLEKPGRIRQALMFVGRMLGEGVFVLHDLRPGLQTLAPAVFAGLASPFPGYSDVGFSTDTRLLDESVPFDQRRAFRMSIALADTPENERIRKDVPSLMQAAWNNLVGTRTSGSTEREFRGAQQSAQFRKVLEHTSVEYDVFYQLDDPEHPELTPIEDADLPWKSPKIKVGTLTLIRFNGGGEYNGGDQNLHGDVARLARQMHFAPGLALHAPVGDLAWVRSLGSLPGPQEQMQAAIGAYSQSAQLRPALAENKAVAELKRLFARNNHLRVMGYGSLEFIPFDP